MKSQLSKLFTGMALATSMLLPMSVIAENAPLFSSQTFETQFVASIAITDKTKWLVYSTHKDGGAWVKKTFNELGWNTAKMADKKVVYIADIHKMPRIISELFALPKMRSYDFTIGLDLKGNQTKNWPRKEEKVAVYQLKQNQLVHAVYFENAEALAVFLDKI